VVFPDSSWSPSYATRRADEALETQPQRYSAQNAPDLLAARRGGLRERANVALGVTNPASLLLRADQVIE
jgi:hypothetical protein